MVHGVVDAWGLEIPPPVAPRPIREAKALVRTVSLGVVSTALFATAAVEARVLQQACTVAVGVGGVARATVKDIRPLHEAPASDERTTTPSDAIDGVRSMMPSWHPS